VPLWHKLVALSCVLRKQAQQKHKSCWTGGMTPVLIAQHSFADLANQAADAAGDDSKKNKIVLGSAVP